MHVNLRHDEKGQRQLLNALARDRVGLPHRIARVLADSWLTASP